MSDQINEVSQPKSLVRPQLNGVASIRTIRSKGLGKSGQLPALDAAVVTSLAGLRLMDR